MTTIFEKIIAREVPADIIYEDEYVIAILDINPIQPGHTLVIPKMVSEDALACSPEDLARVILVAQKLAPAIMAVTNCDGINFLMNNGEAAGQKVFHTHLHIIPRFTDDGVYDEPLPGEYESGEAESLAANIAAQLAS